MTSKLIFMFDLSNKPLTTYNDIKEALDLHYLKNNVLKILNTTYVIKTTDLPEQLYNYLLVEGLIDLNDRCFASSLIYSTSMGILNDQKSWDFINS